MGDPLYIPSYTAADYAQWEGNWELWQGIPVAMSPSPTIGHQLVSGEIYAQLRAALNSDDRCRCAAVFETDWEIAADTVVRPDIAVICAFERGRAIDRPPAMIVEVLSPATASKDRIQKRRLYAEQGVGWYLIADPEQSTFELLRLDGDRYVDAPADAGIDLADGCRIRLDERAAFASRA